MIALTTLTESIVERLKEERVVLIPASLDEYVETLAELEGEPFKIEYINGNIRASMSQASDNHETLVMNIGALLRELFYDKLDYRVMGSNKVVYVEACELAVNPDALVVKGESQLFPRKGKVAGIINPYILVEVHSDATESKDMAEKLPCYKKLESIHQIIYIDQHKPYITVYTKNQDIYHWFNNDYDSLDAMVQIGESEISMREIYHKVNMPTQQHGK